MKTTITLLIIFIWASSYGQFDKLKGTWISSDQDLICIRDTNTLQRKNSNKLSNKREGKRVELSIQNDTLKFFFVYWYSDSIYKDPYYLQIIYHDDSALIVKPVSDYSKKFFQNRESLKFVRQEYTIDTTIKLKKIIYHTTDDCLLPNDDCPEINMQIDNNMHIYLDGVFRNKNYEQVVEKTGQFTGILSHKLYNELICLLQTCNLRTLTFDDKWGYTDSPQRTFIIYFNDQRKYLNSTNPPFIVDELIEFLDTINSRTNLTRTNEKIELEK